MQILTRFSKFKLTDDALNGQKQVEFWNITTESKNTKRTDEEKSKDFIDNPEVPPLE